MADIVDAATRSRMMSGIRGKNTGPERELRRQLWARGFRFRIHDRSTPGTPDISHKGRKVAIFVDGCFWHGCPLHYKRPSTRMKFWDSKIAANRKRREVVLHDLREARWNVLQVWECEVRADPAAVANKAAALLGSMRSGGASP